MNKLILLYKAIINDEINYQDFNNIFMNKMKMMKTR